MKYCIRFKIDKHAEKYLGDYEIIQRLVFDSSAEAQNYFNNMTQIQKENAKIMEIK